MYRSSFRECFFYILRKWKIIVVVALLAGFGLAGLKCFKVVKNWDKDVDELTEAHEIYDAAYKSYENSISQYESIIANLDAEIANQEQKNSENTFLNYDPNNIGYCTKSYAVQALSTDVEALNSELDGSFFSVMIFSLKMNIDWDVIGDVIGIDEEYAPTFCRFSSDETRQILTVNCVAETEEQAITACGIINDYILTYATEEAAYTIACVYDYSSTGQIPMYDDIVNEVRNKTIDLTNMRNAKQADMEKLEAPKKPSPIPSVSGTIKSAVKHFTFGVAAGGVLVVLYLYVLYYLNGKLHSEEELQFYSEGYSYSFVPNGRKPIKGISGFIARKDCRGLLYSQEEALSRVISNVKASNLDIKSVMFTGCSSEQEIVSFKDTLDKLKNKEMTFGVEKNILLDKNALDNLEKYDAIVIVEAIDKAQIALIKKEIDRIHNSGKTIICSMICR